MAKVRGPLLSLDARGQIGKSQVYGTWKGVQYARQYTAPSNPSTAAQVAVRSVFAALDELWKRTGPLTRETWNAETERRPMTPRNSWIRFNLPLLRGKSDISSIVISPGARSGPSASAVNAVAGTTAGTIKVTVSVSQVPSGWTAVSVVAVAVRNQSPSDTPSEYMREKEAPVSSAPSSVDVTLSGLTSGKQYVVVAWPVWMRPDGRRAYGASLSAGLVTAP